MLLKLQGLRCLVAVSRDNSGVSAGLKAGLNLRGLFQALWFCEKLWWMFGAEVVQGGGTLDNTVGTDCLLGSW